MSKTKKHDVNRLARQIANGLGLDPSYQNPFSKGPSTVEKIEQAMKERPSKKMSKRLAKKLAKTGRTSTKQKISVKPPLNKPSSSLPKVGPKPKSPKLPPKKTPEELEKLHQAEYKQYEDQSYEEWRSEYDRRQFLRNMVVGHIDGSSSLNGFLSKEQIAAIEDGLYEADMALVDQIHALFEDDEEWKEFYKFLSDRDTGYVDEELVETKIFQIMDILGIEY